MQAHAAAQKLHFSCTPRLERLPRRRAMCSPPLHNSTPLPPTRHPLPCAGNRYPLEQASEAIQETAKPQRGGKCFLEG